MRSGIRRRAEYRGKTPTIGIVGGGASGALTAIHLLRQASFPLKIVIIEPRANLGGGIAYSTTCDSHLLNVRAGKMSAFSDDPDHFVRWLRKNSARDCGAHAFVRRSLYGDYLGDTLYDCEGLARGFVSIDHYRSTVTRVETTADLARISLGNDLTILADRVVLAIGNQARTNPLPFPHNAEILSAWEKSAFEALDPVQPVLLIGTGLTAVDAVLELEERRHLGAIHAVSRHGNWPREQGQVGARSDDFGSPRSGTPLEALRALRQHIRQSRDWQSAIDGLRPYTDQIWRSWPATEKRRFLRHLHHYWEIHRHRLPIETLAKIDDLKSRGRLLPHAGRIVEAASHEDGLIRARMVLRGARGELSLAVSRIIDCTGPETDLRKSANPLVVDLLDSGVAQADGYGLGLLSDEIGAVVDSHGIPSRTLFALGPPRRGTLSESTAINEIRHQAAALARQLRNELRSSSVSGNEAAREERSSARAGV